MAIGDFKSYDDMDRSFIGILREKWTAEGTMTQDEVRRMANAMIELDYRCEQLQRILRDEIVPSTIDWNNDRLRRALISYQIRVWELREFNYLTDLEQIIEDVTGRLEDEGSSNDTSEGEYGG